MIGELEKKGWTREICSIYSNENVLHIAVIGEIFFFAMRFASSQNNLPAFNLFTRPIWI